MVSKQQNLRCTSEKYIYGYKYLGSSSTLSAILKNFIDFIKKILNIWYLSEFLFNKFKREYQSMEWVILAGIVGLAYYLNQ